MKAWRSGEPLKKKIITVEVAIEGCVRKPGVYLVSRGTPMGEVIKRAGLRKFADLRPLRLQEPILQPVEIVIPALQQLKIRVEGAVKNPGQLAVLPGTKIADLKKILLLEKEADLTFFRKKRQLQEGEIIKIPTRKS